ncbi:hypothetical protein PN36_15795 [Candidatus Thiomargarita nelsonii]|uniref:FdxN element excision controlling factor protein n=1 Tax=Candidatus Thiomargarita nelsonii TaxID=1003181 RepID=A0A0A6S479_9GAMM|nr:hypothetical protein PN36_15795 [Candidatus Thiomargarita nelsonii]
MDTRLNYQTLIENILLDYAQYKPAYGEIEPQVVFDEPRVRYTLLEMGWDNKKYVHDCIIHVELINDKIWIQYDGTEEGIATDLVEAGVPKYDIVLGFRPQKLRQYTGFAEK